MQYIIRGESIFIPFKNGRSISDSQCRPRIYKSEENFKKSFPLHNHNWNELIEYAEVKHGKWLHENYECSFCGESLRSIMDSDGYFSGDFKGCNYCPNCGAKMDTEE